MNMTRILLLCLALAVSGEALAGNALGTIEELKSEGKLPGFSKQGVFLPRALLLDEIRKSLDPSKAEVKDLELSEQKGTLTLLVHDKVDALLSIDFRFMEVDWPKRTIWMQYSESTQSASDTLLGRIFGSIAIAVFEGVSGVGHLESAFSGKPWFVVDKDRVGILLDKVPSLQKTLSASFGKYRVFDFVGIRSLKTEKDGIRASLGFV